MVLRVNVPSFRKVKNDEDSYTVSEHKLFLLLLNDIGNNRLLSGTFSFRKLYFFVLRIRDL